MESELELIIRSLVAKSKFRINDKHIFRERAHREFSIDEVLYSLKNGFLYKVQKPHRVLWACRQEPTKNLIILSL